MKKIYIRQQKEKTVDDEELIIIEIFHSNPNNTHDFILFSQK